MGQFLGENNSSLMHLIFNLLKSAAVSLVHVVRPYLAQPIILQYGPHIKEVLFLYTATSCTGRGLTTCKIGMEKLTMPLLNLYSLLQLAVHLNKLD